MTSPDRAEDKAAVAAKEIGYSASKLWLQAHADGIRNGLEAAAAVIGAMGEDLPRVLADDTVFTVGNVQWYLGEIASRIRLQALQVECPDPPEVPR